MNTRTAVITGANSGLGLECARALLAGDASWHVVLAVRDPSRGADAVAQLREPTRCTVLEMDLASLRSVSGFVPRLRAAGLPPVHALVCNAGVQVVAGTEVTDPSFDGVTGKYFAGRKPIRSSADSYDRDKALDLWETSERLLTHVTK
jgi:NAD(P)-dependent dehydrogenase (short-subunit alcohol dehydrogenase family)